MNGLTNIKNALDYKSYEMYNQLIKNYDISILYLAKCKYSLNIKQKIPLSEDINEIYDLIIKEITERCQKNNLFLTI
jgi:hypothetical protein